MLDSNLPGSYDGQYGHIKYYLKARINKTQLFSIDEKRKLDLIMYSPAYASMQEMMVLLVFVIVDI